MYSSFITLDRKILEWEWYKNANVSRLFIHCLIKANWQDKKYEGIMIKRSTFMTSYGKLSTETGLSVKEVRTALKKLISTGELEVNEPKSGKKGKAFTLVTVCKYDDYQTINRNRGTEGAQEGHRKGTEGAQKGQLLTIYNNNNNNNNENNNVVIRAAEENLKLLLEDEKYITAMTTKFNISADQLEEFYQTFNEHLIQTKNDVRDLKDYTSHFLSWYCKKYNVDRRTGKRNIRTRKVDL